MSLKFDLYIYRLHKQIHPGLNLSTSAKTKLSELVNTLVKDFIRTLVVFTEHCRKNTISSREVQNAVRVLILGDLGKKAVSAGVKAVIKYTSFYQKKKKRTLGAQKAGLLIPPVRIRSIIEANINDYKPSVRISETSAVYLAGVVEYIMEEILDMSGELAIATHKKTITLDDIVTVIRNDNELNKTLHCTLQSPLV